jgi:hypothetical protein
MGKGGKALRVTLGALFGLFFMLPLYAMADFSTRNLLDGGRTLAAWRNLVADEALYQATVASLLLAFFTVLLTLVILVPVPTAAGHSGAGDRRRDAQRLSVGHLPPRRVDPDADVRLRHRRAAVRLSRPRQRTVFD